MIRDFVRYVAQHMAWSLQTFGGGRRTVGLTKHIAKELDEIRQAPTDLTEWVDVIILAIDGAWRAGYCAQEIADALWAKQEKNMARQWPANVSEDEPTEHIRGIGHD